MGRKTMSIRHLRKAAILGLPLLTSAGAVLGYLYPHRGVYDAVFKIALSGTVGLWTNHFAIRMLFRPHRRTVFGRQGLIPAKRAELAKAVGEAVAQRLLDTDAVLDYLHRHHLLEKGAQGAVDWAHRLFTRPSVRRTVAGTLQKVLQDLVDQHAETLTLGVQGFLEGLLREKASPSVLWPLLRERIHRELSDPRIRRAAARTVIRLADRYDTQIAAFINDALDDYIREKRIWEKWILGLGKKALRVDEETIRREIRRRAGSPDFFQSLLGFLDESTPDIQRWLDSPEARTWFHEKMDYAREKAAEWIRTEGAAMGPDRIRTLLSSDGFWEWVLRQVDVQVERLAAKAREKILSREFRGAAERFARNTVSRIDVQGIVQDRVDRLDLNQLEDLVLRVSGENLAAIELFGALLGCLAGVVLVDVRLLPVLPLGILAFLLMEKALTRALGGSL